MVIFIQKIKTKEGINSLNLDKLKKEVPVDYELINQEPTISYTSNHVILSWKCKTAPLKKEEPPVKEATPKKEAASKKTLSTKKEAAAKKETAKTKPAAKKKNAPLTV